MFNNVIFQVKETAWWAHKLMNFGRENLKRMFKPCGLVQRVHILGEELQS